MVPNLFEERVEEADGLDGLAKSHLVGKDGVDVVDPGVAQPVDPLQLVGVHHAPRLGDEVRLLHVLLRTLRRTHSDALMSAVCIQTCPLVQEYK